MAVLTSQSPRKSNFVVVQGKLWVVDWETGTLTRCGPPDYGECVGVDGGVGVGGGDGNGNGDGDGDGDGNGNGNGNGNGVGVGVGAGRSPSVGSGAS